MCIDKRSDLAHTLLGGTDLLIGPGRIAGRRNDRQGASIHGCGQLCHIGSLGNTEGRLAYLRQICERLQILRENGILEGTAVLIESVSKLNTHARSPEHAVGVIHSTSRCKITKLASIFGEVSIFVTDSLESDSIPGGSVGMEPDRLF